MRYLTVATGADYLVVDTESGNGTAYVKARCANRPDAAFLVNALNAFVAEDQDELPLCESAA